MALTNSGVVEPLLNSLNPSGDPKLIEASARTLNAIYASPKVSRQQLFQVFACVTCLETSQPKKEGKAGFVWEICYCTAPFRIPAETISDLTILIFFDQYALVNLTGQSFACPSSAPRFLQQQYSTGTGRGHGAHGRVGGVNLGPLLRDIRPADANSLQRSYPTAHAAPRQRRIKNSRGGPRSSGCTCQR